jgi:hypothetical protein
VVLSSQINAADMVLTDRLNWRSVIVTTLTRLFPASTPEEVESHFKPLWDRLNRSVYPSSDLSEKLTGESAPHLHQRMML